VGWRDRQTDYREVGGEHRSDGRGNILGTNVGSTLVIRHAVGGDNLTFPVGGAGGLGMKYLNIQVSCPGPLAGRRMGLTLQTAESLERRKKIHPRRQYEQTLVGIVWRSVMQAKTYRDGRE